MGHGNISRAQDNGVNAHVIIKRALCSKGDAAGMMTTRLLCHGNHFAFLGRQHRRHYTDLTGKNQLQTGASQRVAYPVL